MRINRASLASAWEHARTTPHLGRNLVLLLIMAAGIVTSSSWVLAQMSFTAPWQDRFEFSVEFDSAPAINPDARQKVTMAGVEVGKVEGWRTTDTGTAVIDLSIDSQYVVHDNAQVVLRAGNPLNVMYLEVSPGGPPAKPLAEGGTLPASQTRSPIQADEVLSHLDERQQQALTSLLVESDVALARAPRDLPRGLRAMDDALVTLQPVVKQLQSRRAKIERLVTAMARISTAVGENNARSTRLIESTQQTLTTLATNGDDLRATLGQLPGLSDHLRKAFSSTQRLTAQLDPTLEELDRASGELPSALERLGDTTRELGKTVDAARPVVAKARPVVADLRPLVDDVHVSLRNALPITTRLKRDTGLVVSHLADLQAYVYNTSSVFSVTDGRGHFVRGHLIVPLPDGGTLPGGRGGYAPGEENGIDQDKRGN